jgi:hypothetical protein
MQVPDDIFTEPDDINPDTLAHLGPLRRFAGIWEGHGVDVNPKADGPETHQSIERMVMQPIDAQANGPQLFYGLRYHTHINTPEEEITFHDQVGYWLWEPATGLIMQTLAIPRAQVALAGGHAGPGDTKLTVSSERGRTDYGICSTDFLEQAFRTDSYRLEVVFLSEGTWSYISTTILQLAGQGPFLLVDRNRFTKVGEADLNPWLKVARNRTA